MSTFVKQTLNTASATVFYKLMGLAVGEYPTKSNLVADFTTSESLFYSTLPTVHEPAIKVLTSNDCADGTILGSAITDQPIDIVPDGRLAVRLSSFFSCDAEYITITVRARGAGIVRPVISFGMCNVFPDSRFDYFSVRIKVAHLPYVIVSCGDVASLAFLFRFDHGNHTSKLLAAAHHSDMQHLAKKKIVVVLKDNPIPNSFFPSHLVNRLDQQWKIEAPVDGAVALVVQDVGVAAFGPLYAFLDIASDVLVEGLIVIFPSIHALHLLVGDASAESSLGLLRWSGKVWETVEHRNRSLPLALAHL